MVLEEYFDKYILNNSIFQDRISRFTNMFVGRKIPTRILKNSGSYTDSKRIVLGIDEKTLRNKTLNERLGDNPELLKSYFIGLGVHEAEHVVSSDFESYKLFHESVVKAYESFYGVSKEVAHLIAKGIGNGIEDGRIERRAANRYPGVAKHLALINYVLFEDTNCLNDEICDLMNNILFIAKSGKLIPGTTKLYKDTELYDILMDIQTNIKVAVAADDVSVMFNECWKVHNRIFHFLGPKLKEEEQQLQELEELLKKISEDIDESMSNPENDEVGNDESVESFIGENIEESVETKNNSSNGDSTKDDSNKNDSNEDDTHKGDSNEDDSGKNNPNKSDTNKNDSSKGNSNKNESDKNNSGKKSSKSDDTDNSKEDKSKGLTEREVEFFKNLIESIKEEEKKESQNKASVKSVAKKVEISLPTAKEISSYTGKHQWKVTDISETSIRVLDGDYKKRAMSLKKDLKEILVDKKSYREIRRRRGALDSRRFTSLVGFHDDRIFYKKEKTEIDEYAFYVIIDNSGSMNGIKHFESLVCASILEEAIKELAPIKFVAFDSFANRTNITTLKEFDKNRKQSLLYADFNTGGCNCDAFILNYAQTELKKRKENKKIIFMLSDGLPTINMNPGEIYDEVQETVQRIRSEGTILIPIAIDDKSFEANTKERFCYMYDDLIIFSDIQEIEKHIVNMIKKILVL